MLSLQVINNGSLLESAIVLAISTFMLGHLWNRLTGLHGQWRLGNFFLDTAVSIVITSLISVYLAVIGAFFLARMVCLAIFLLLLLILGAKYLLKRGSPQKMSERLSLKKEFLLVAMFLAIALSSLIIFSHNIYQENLFINLDPWTIRPAITDILENKKGFFSVRLGNYDLGFYKGFYFWTALNEQLGILPGIRYLGWFFFALSIGLLFTLFVYLKASMTIFISSIFLLANPRLITRFSMPIRETYGFALLVLLLTIMTRVSLQKRGFRKIKNISLIILVLSATTLSHSLVALLALIYLLSMIFYFIFNRKVKEAVIFVLIIAIASIFSLGGTIRPFINVLNLIV